MMRHLNGCSTPALDLARPSGLKELAQTMKLVPTNVNLAIVFIASFFKAGCK